MKYLKKELQMLKPYHSSILENGVIMNANESPFNLPLQIINDFKDKISNIEFNRYPDMDNLGVTKSISRALNLDICNVSVGVGSDELIDTIFKCVINKDDKVLLMNPSFSMYQEFCNIHLACSVKVDLEDDFTFNVNKFISNITPDIKLIILCNPNNPTGSKIECEDIKKILDYANCLVILDEAYIEFMDCGSISLINEYDNLIILRTFSKAYSMSSMRLGYAISNCDNIQMIDTIKPPYNINTITQMLGSSVMDNKELFDDYIKYLVNERNRVYNILLQNNICVYKSYANFLWMELNDKQIKALKESNIHIRHIKYNNKTYQRVSISFKEDNDLFLKEVILNA